MPLVTMDVCIIEDAASTISNEEIVRNWDAKFSRKLANKLAICQNGKVFEDTLKDYCRILEEYVINFRAKKLLKDKILNHVKVFHLHYVQNDGTGLEMVNYLDYMEKMLVILCNLEFEVIYQLKRSNLIKEYNRTIRQIAQEMIYILTVYLLRDEQRIFHVLLKLDYKTDAQSWKDVMQLVFRYYLITSPLKDLSILCFCRNYLLFQKWKCIADKNGHSGMDKIMYFRFNMTPESIKNNAITRKLLLPSTQSFIGIVDILTSSWQTCVDSYLKYVEHKKREEDEIYLHSINLDSDEEENMVESIFIQTEQENRRINRIKGEKIAPENVNYNEVSTSSGQVVYVIDDDDSDIEEISIICGKRIQKSQVPQLTMSYLDSIPLLDDNSNNSTEMLSSTTTVETESDSALSSTNSANPLISVYLNTYRGDRNSVNVSAEKVKTTTLIDKTPDNSETTENTQTNLTTNDTSSYDVSLKCLNSLSPNNSESQSELKKENENFTTNSNCISKEVPELDVSVMDIQTSIDRFSLPNGLMTPPPSDRVGDEICIESLESFTTELHNSSSKIIESLSNRPPLPDTPPEIPVLIDSNNKEELQVENPTVTENTMLILEESLENSVLHHEDDFTSHIEITKVSTTIEEMPEPSDEIINDNLIAENVITMQSENSKEATNISDTIEETAKLQPNNVIDCNLEMEKAIEPILNLSESVLNSNESIHILNESVLDSRELDLNSSEPVLNSSELDLGANESVLNLREPVLNSSEPIFNTSETICNSSEPVLYSSESVHNLNEPILDSNELVLYSSKSAHNPNEPVLNSSEPILNSSKSILYSVEAILKLGEPNLNSSEPVFNLSEPILNSSSTVEKSQYQERNLNINTSSKKIKKKTHHKTNNINIEKIEKAFYSSNIPKEPKIKKSAIINKISKGNSTVLDNKNSKEDKNYQHENLNVEKSSIAEITNNTISSHITQEKFYISNIIETNHKVDESKDENNILKDTKKIHYKNTIDDLNSDKLDHKQHHHDNTFININTNLDKLKKSPCGKSLKPLEKIHRRKSIDCNLNLMEFEKSILNSNTVEDNKTSKKSKKTNNKNITDLEKIGKIHYSILDKEETKKAYKSNLSDRNLRMEEDNHSHYTYKIHDNKNLKKVDQKVASDTHEPLEKIEKLLIKIEKVPTFNKTVESNKSPKKTKKANHKACFEKIDAILEQTEKSELNDVMNNSNLDASKSKISKSTKKIHHKSVANTNKNLEKERFPININLDEMRKSLYKSMTNIVNPASHDSVTANITNNLKDVLRTNNKIENSSNTNLNLENNARKDEKKQPANVNFESKVEKYLPSNVEFGIVNSNKNTRILSEYVIENNGNLKKLHTWKETKIAHTSTIKETNPDKSIDISPSEVIVEPVSNDDRVNILHESCRENINNEDDYNSADMDIEQLTPMDIILNGDLPHNQIIVRTENTSITNSLSENLSTQNYNKEYESNFSKDNFINEFFPNLNTELVQNSTCKIQASVCMPQLDDKKINKVPRKKNAERPLSSERKSKMAKVKSQKSCDNHLSTLSDFQQSLFGPLEPINSQTPAASNNDNYSDSAVNKQNDSLQDSPEEVSPPYEDIQAQEYQAHVLEVNGKDFVSKNSLPQKPIRSIIAGSSKKRKIDSENLPAKKARVNFGTIDIRIIPPEVKRVSDVFIEEAKESMKEYKVGFNDRKLLYLQPQVKVQMDSQRQILCKRQALMFDYIIKHRNVKDDVVIDSCIITRVDYIKQICNNPPPAIEKKQVAVPSSCVDFPSKSSLLSSNNKERETLCRIDFSPNYATSSAHDLLEASAKGGTSDSSTNILEQGGLSDASYKTLFSNNALSTNDNDCNSEILNLSLSISKNTLNDIALPESEFSRSPKFSPNPDQIVKQCLMDKALESNDLDVTFNFNNNTSFLSNNSNFYTNLDKVNMLNNNMKPEEVCSCTSQTICNYCKIGIEKNIKNFETETSLPIKKRKVTVVDVSQKLNKKIHPVTEEISYPATPMISIAEIEALKQNHRLPNINVKTPTQHSEMSSLPVLYNLNSVDPSPIIADQFNINNHTYNNPTINYHMNNVPVPSIYHGTFVPYTPYYSLPPIILPHLHTFDNPSNIYNVEDNKQIPTGKVVKKEKKEKKKHQAKNKYFVDPYSKFT